VTMQSYVYATVITLLIGESTMAHWIWWQQVPSQSPLSGLSQTLCLPSIHLSEHSDILELVITGKGHYGVPAQALSSEGVLPSRGTSLSAQAWRATWEGKHNISWTLNSQQCARMLYQACFALNSDCQPQWDIQMLWPFENDSQGWSKS
ncbi:hypothetical protein A6R68_07539, partial [Neotoma lepida]